MESLLLSTSSYEDSLWSRDLMDEDSHSFLLDEWTERGSVILNDKMFCESIEQPSIQTEHSYSLGASLDLDPIKVEPMDDYQEMDADLFLTPPQETTTTTTTATTVEIKTEPPSPPVVEVKPTIIMAKSARTIPRVTVKVEPTPASQPAIFGLPPTPPSSVGSDSEGSTSPERCGPPPKTSSRGGASRHARSSGGPPPEHSQYISYQEKGSTGEIHLTEEELRTLKAEGFDIPKRLPLTKNEERTLKKIRRKIKNKISAQESRRKKKEYMDTLEKRVEMIEKLNLDYKMKIEKLENINRTIKAQCQQLQSRQVPRHSKSTQTNLR